MLSLLNPSKRILLNTWIVISNSVTLKYLNYKQTRPSFIYY